eukprot:6181076-Pleurochrysis_carterae.AAC.1
MCSMNHHSLLIRSLKARSHRADAQCLVAPRPWRCAVLVSPTGAVQMSIMTLSLKVKVANLLWQPILAFVLWRCRCSLYACSELRHHNPDTTPLHKESRYNAPS